jgi:hypothetical protein
MYLRSVRCVADVWQVFILSARYKMAAVTLPIDAAVFSFK